MTHKKRQGGCRRRKAGFVGIMAGDYREEEGWILPCIYLFTDKLYNQLINFNAIWSTAAPWPIHPNSTYWFHVHWTTSNLAIQTRIARYGTLTERTVTRFQKRTSPLQSQFPWKWPQIGFCTLEMKLKIMSVTQQTLLSLEVVNSSQT